MKKIIFLLFFILIPLASAKVETTEALNINDSATVYGKTITILSVGSSGKLKVNVDGVEGIVRQEANKTTNVNEMFIEILNFTYFDSENIETIFKLKVNFECGDDICNRSETILSCCTDCGCEGNLKCINNICQEEDCVINLDCEDDNLCTTDECSSTPPRTCSNILIDQCINNDSCCPSNCSYENDTDCEEKVIEETIEVESEIEEESNVTESEIVVEETKKEPILDKEERKGIIIMVLTALLVIIVGSFILLRKKL